MHALEIELKFQVPASARAALVAELRRGAGPFSRESLIASYLDTPDGRLARAGLAWRVRREGRRWVQALKAADERALERFEHEVIRPDDSLDASLHAGTGPGDLLIAVLRRARHDGLDPEVRFRSEVRRRTRRVRTRGAVVDLSFDEGRLVAGERVARVRELELELVSGATTAMLALAERWRKRFGLIFDPRSKAERGGRLAEGSEHAAPRKAVRPRYAASAGAADAFAAVVDECLAQMCRNAAGLCDGDPALRVEHVHQLRIGIRRLRSALRIFDGWVEVPPARLVEGLRGLFAALGQTRDSDVLRGSVAVELAAAGAPALHAPSGGSALDPAELLRSDASQHLLLGWLAWRAGLGEAAPPAPVAEDGSGATGSGAEHGRREQPDTAMNGADAVRFQRAIAKRLRRWHGRFVDDWKSFATLDDEALHALRKRIKRQRYAVEFFAPLLKRRAVDRYLKRLVALQEHMGELNDLFVARARFQALVDADPAAWFALGWLTARIAAARAAVGSALRELTRVAPPST